jgi:hypothetical protein
VLNVGWLDDTRDYNTAEPSSLFLEKLTKILEEVGEFDAHVNPIRGTHTCNLCGERKFESHFLGSSELWIPATKVGNLYAAPSLIVHYIDAHNYKPPEEFIDAVLRIDTQSTFNAQTCYDALVESLTIRSRS